MARQKTEKKDVKPGAALCPNCNYVPAADKCANCGYVKPKGK